MSSIEECWKRSIFDLTCCPFSPFVKLQDLTLLPEKDLFVEKISEEVKSAGGGCGGRRKLVPRSVAVRSLSLPRGPKITTTQLNKKEREDVQSDKQVKFHVCCQWKRNSKKKGTHGLIYLSSVHQNIVLYSSYIWYVRGRNNSRSRLLFEETLRIMY